MSHDEHGIPGPDLGALRTASANLMGLRLGGALGRQVQAAAELDRYYNEALALGATREQAENALCGTTAPTERDRKAALRRFKDGSPPMSDELRETVGHLVRSSRFSFADIAGAVEVLSADTLTNPQFTPWTDDQLAKNLPDLMKMAAGPPGYSVASIASLVRLAST